MRALNLGLHCKINVWLEELPDITYSVESVCERRYSVQRRENAREMRAAVELLLPRGGRAQYGLLGGSFELNNADQFVVQVALSRRDERRLDWSLASAIDDVRAGLPAEYAGGVLAGLIEGPAALGAGILRLDCAAHGAVGSSGDIFKQLAALLVDILALKSASLLESKIAARFSAVESRPSQ